MISGASKCVRYISYRICFQSDLTMEITQGIFHQHEAKIEAIMDFQHGYGFDAIMYYHVCSSRILYYRATMFMHHHVSLSCHVLSNTRSKTISLQFLVDLPCRKCSEWLCNHLFSSWPRRLIQRVNSRHQTDLKQYEHTIMLLESLRHDYFRVPDGHMDPYMVNSFFDS